MKTSLFGVVCLFVLGCGRVPEPGTEAVLESNGPVGEVEEIEKGADPTPVGTVVVDPGVVVPVPAEEPEEEAPAPVLSEQVLWSGAASWPKYGFSEDGSTVFYARSTLGLASDLYATRVATGETRFVSENVVAIYPDDGQTILFRRTVDGGGGSWHDLGELWAYDWKTHQETLISETVVRHAYRFVPGDDAVVFVDTLAKALTHFDLKTQQTIELDSNVWTVPWANPVQGLPMSEDGTYLAWTANKALKLAALDTMTVTTVSEHAVNRTARFDGDWLTWHEPDIDENGGKEYRVVSRRLDDGATVASSAGVSHVPGEHGVVAYLTDFDDQSLATLEVWDRATLSTVTVDTKVAHGDLMFDPTGRNLLYMRKPSHDTDSYADHGPLWRYDVDTGDRTLVHPDAWQAWGTLGIFDPSGDHLVYRTGPCNEVGLHLLDVESGAEVKLPSYTCDAPFMQPDATGMIFERHKPNQLLRHEFGAPAPILVAEDSLGFMATPSGGGSAHIISGLDPALLLMNWTTGAEVRKEFGKPKLLAVSDTHVLYRTTKGGHRLRLQELP